MGVFVMVWLCKEEGSSPVSLQLLRGKIWAYVRCPCLCLYWVWDGDYVTQLPYVWYYVGVKSQRWPMCYRCLMFNSSGPCELLFYFVLLPLGPEL